jgi:hypothetical protein
MNAREELIERLAEQTKNNLGQLSGAAYAELVHAVRKDPAEFARTAADESELVVVNALERFERDLLEDEFLDDNAFAVEHAAWIARLRSGLARALSIDPMNVKARLIEMLTREGEAGERYDALHELENLLTEQQGTIARLAGADDPYALRDRMRVHAAIARTAIEAGDYKMARDVALNMLDVDEKDPFGARYTLALAFARLEDEDGFNRLDQSLHRHGNAWSNLARVLLLYKLDHEAAAKRALKTFLTLNDGAAYALLRPLYIEPYLPDRPEFDPGSFEEATLAVSEAEPIIMDTPDFIGWVSSQADSMRLAETFAADNDLEW